MPRKLGTSNTDVADARNTAVNQLRSLQADVTAKLHEAHTSGKDDELMKLLRTKENLENLSRDILEIAQNPDIDESMVNEICSDYIGYALADKDAFPQMNNVLINLQSAFSTAPQKEIRKSPTTVTKVDADSVSDLRTSTQDEDGLGNPSIGEHNL